MTIELPITGRCYCGNFAFLVSRKPQAAAYSHCDDCKRSSGAPVAAFVAFDEKAVTISPDDGKSFKPGDGVTRTFCDTCESRRLPWLHLEDSAQRFPRSSQTVLRGSRNPSTETVQ